MISMIALLESLVTLFAVMRITGMATTNPLSIVLFLAFAFIYANFQKSISESRFAASDHLHSCILAALFSILTLFVTYEQVTINITSNLFCAGILLLVFAGLFSGYYHLLLWIFLKTASLDPGYLLYPVAWLPYVAFFACILGWLPYFLHEFPGVMTPDSINQFAQAVGVWELNNQHSVLHTLLIMVFYKMGLALTGSSTAGIAFYTMFQMMFMAFTAAYTVRTLQLCKLKTAYCIAAICFYALLPYHGALCVTIWKDVIFAGCVTLFTASCIRMLMLNLKEKLKISTLLSVFLPYIIAGFSICLLRSNGLYAFIIMIPFLFLVFRERWKHFVPATLFSLILALFIRYPCMQIYQINQSDFAESCSIPLQQIARVVSNGEILTQDQEERLSAFITIDDIPAAYDEHVSDPVKALVRAHGITALEENKKEFFSLWLSIGLKHPKAYFDAFVSQTYGYWYPDAYSDVGLADGIYPNDFGLSWSPILKGSLVLKVRELLFKFQQIIPVYGLLWSIGFIFWTILVCVGICFCRKNASMAVIFIFPIALVVTLILAAPVAVEFRYAYPLFYALPLYLSAPYIKTNS